MASSSPGGLYDDMPMPSDESADTEPDPMDEGGDDDMPPEFTEAYAAYEDSPSAKTLWDVIEACTGNSTATTSKGGGGLAALLGKTSKK